MYNRHDLELVNDVDRNNKLVKNISFNYAVELDDDLVAVHKTRGNVKLDKFNYIGFVVLEKAKLYLYKAIYEYFEKELDCSYHFSGSDSLFIRINVPLDSDIETEMNKRITCSWFLFLILVPNKLLMKKLYLGTLI